MVEIFIIPENLPESPIALLSPEAQKILDKQEREEAEEKKKADAEHKKQEAELQKKMDEEKKKRDEMKKQHKAEADKLALDILKQQDNYGPLNAASLMVQRRYRHNQAVMQRKIAFRSRYYMAAFKIQSFWRSKHYVGAKKNKRKRHPTGPRKKYW